MTETMLPNTVNAPDAARGLVFMGGVGYYEERNRFVGGKIIEATGAYSHVITIPDPITDKVAADTMVFEFPHTTTELTIGSSLKHLHVPVQNRYSKLQEQQARALIEAIHAAGGQPVDAVFQSYDTSVGLLAMRMQPYKFRKVVLLDPSSIAKLPPRWQYLKEEWRAGNLRRLATHRKGPDESVRFEEPASKLQKRKRVQGSLKGKNKFAPYVSYQAQMLHEIAAAEHAPEISIVASRVDNAYTPERILKSLVSLDDIKTFFVTNTRHGLIGKQVKLDQLIAVLTEVPASGVSFLDKLHFADAIPQGYRNKLRDIVQGRLP